MGIKRKNKNIKLSIEHYSSQLFINKISTCYNCPLKLYSKENDTIVFGTGNRITDTMIILSSYDIKADVNYNNILKIVRDTYKDITGKELLENCYVTRTIKCINKTDFNLEKEAIKNCICNLYYELIRIKPTKLIIFDKQLYDFELYNYNRGKYNVKTVISPAVIYYDNQNLKDVFVRQFKEAIYDT